MSLEIPYRSIPDMLAQRVAATPDNRAFGYPTDTGIAWMTWGEVGTRADRIAAGLLGLGIEPEERVSILASTRVDWLLADFGVMNAGAATTTVYPTTEPADAAYIVGDSESVMLIAENPDQAAKMKAANLPHLRHVVLMDGEPTAVPDLGVPVTTLAD